MLIESLCLSGLGDAHLVYGEKFDSSSLCYLYFHLGLVIKIWFPFLTTLVFHREND